METTDPTFEAVIDTVFDGLDDRLEYIRGLAGKTDADFIVDGTLDPSLKAQNRQAVREAIDGFNVAIVDSAPYATAQEAGLEPAEVAVVAYTAGRNLRMRRFDSRSNDPMPDVPESVETVRPLFTENVAKVNEAIAWWKNDAPAFVTFSDEHTAAVFPAHGPDNVVIEEGHSDTVDREAKILATFEGGQRVRIQTTDGRLTWIDIDESLSTFSHPILGYGRHIRATPDSFRDSEYNRFAFAGFDGLEGEASAVLPTPAQLFAARVATEVLLTETEHELVGVRLPTPEPEFAHGVLQFLADSTVRAFMSPELQAQVHDGSGSFTGYSVDGVSIHEVRNQIKETNEQRLRVFLGAAGFGIDSYRNATLRILEDIRELPNLGGRIEAIKAQDGVKAFLDTL